MALAANFGAIAGFLLTPSSRARTTPAFTFAAADRSDPQKIALAVLENFNTRFLATNTKIVTAIPQPDASPATYVPFTYEPFEGGPTNTRTIFVQREKVGFGRSEIAQKISEDHEKIHAMQDTEVNLAGEVVDLAEAHATPFNEGSPEAMVVEDWVWKMIMTEGHDFAATARKWAFEEIAHPERSAEIRKEMAQQPVTLEDWDRCVAKYPEDPQAQMRMASTMWWHRIKEPDPGVDEQISLLDYYVRYAIWLYEISERLNPKFDHLPKEFVRIDRERVALAIGNSFGPNPFARGGKVDPNFVLMPPVAEFLQKRMADLVVAQGGPRETKRTLDEALHARDVTREEYVVDSQGNISWFVPDKPKLNSSAVVDASAPALAA